MRPKRLVAAGLGLLGLLFGSAAMAATQTAPSAHPPVPARGAYIGGSIFYDHDQPKYDQAGGQIGALEADLGRTLDIDNSYYCFGPLPLAQIASGQADPYIMTEAAEVKTFPGPVFIRWEWEMDTGANASCVKAEGGAKSYKAAWVRLWNDFQQAGATNAVFVWCPDRAGFNPRSANPARRYYPGNRYVDYICADGYDMTRYTKGSSPFDELFQHAYDYAQTKGKPFMVGETRDPASDCNQGPWISAFLTEVEAHPDVKAVLYWDSWTTGDGGHDYTIGWPSSDATAPNNLIDFRQFVRYKDNSYFNPRGLPLRNPRPTPMLDDSGTAACAHPNR